ncbi:NucA/NucB deoxyribonuclease domain-containing protein [Streptomyces glaucescens]|uniref:NucA/NucB deoxyribonuclease domain-containing protein n=1 Tax=Streptomyces glaucescens TaxID=1907 RepID=UPI003F571B47
MRRRHGGGSGRARTGRSARHRRDSVQEPPSSESSTLTCTLRSWSAALSIKECEKGWGNYSGSGLECDEYPFASIHQGRHPGLRPSDRR